MRYVVTMLLLCASAAFAQDLPDAPSFSRTTETRTADKEFWITTGVYGASVAADAITTSLWVGRTSNCPSVYVTNGFRGTIPSSARSGMMKAGEFVIATAVSYEFKKYNLHIGKMKLWELPILARTYTHSHDTINNFTVCR
jgi:hypothetical protein